jgi:anaerobic selenocysteine-containing dehydrogenase
MCTQRLGTLASWLVQALNLATGRVDTVGGMMFPSPAVDVVAIMTRFGMRGSYDTWRSRVRQLPEFGGDPPLATLADEIETPGQGQVRGLITIAGNPALSAPNGSRLDAAMASLEHVVAIDPYLNETTRHAHVLLPPAPPLSRAHYDLALSAFAVRNVAKFSAPVVPRAADQRHDWEIVSDLAARTLAPRVLRPLATRTLHALRPERLLDLMLRTGPYRLSLDTLRGSPHGIDLGALEAGRLPSRIGTGSIDLAPADFVAEAGRELVAEADRAVSSDLVLIGRRQLRDKNSWLHNARRLVKGPSRCTLLVHPDDAAARGLVSGDLAQLVSAAGAIVVPVEVTEAMRIGVVSLPHGWGHQRDHVRLTVAQSVPGMSANDVTSDRHLDTLSGNAAFNGLPVVLRRAGTPA